MRLLPLLLALLLAACQRETTVERADREGIFLMGNGAEPKALYPQLVTGVPESKIISALFEGLVADDATDDDAAPPGAAASWTHNAELTEWTFELRPDGRWSDGEPVTADDFVFAYHRLLNPELIAPYSEMLYFLAGAKAYNQDHRGEVLFRQGAQAKLPWDQVRTVNFRGNPEINLDAHQNRGWDELGEAERGDWVRSTPFPRPPVRPDGCFRSIPPKANS